MSCPLVVGYGAGVDSSAMLVGLVWLGVRPDLILFADTGGEKDETYAFIPVMNEYLARHNFPPIITVRNVVKDFKNWPPYHTLEENCLTNGTLPSVAFGWQMKTCSLKWKAAPQHRYCRQYKQALDCWEKGEKVLRAIGFDTSPADQRRRNHAGTIDDPYYSFSYPLQEWGWNREKCKEVLLQAGLPVPPKSACFFCPASQTDEIRALPKDKLRRIVLMEARAEPRLKSIQGLWGVGRKGTRGGQRRPGRMTDFILEENLLPAEEVTRLREKVPLELVAYQEAYARGEYIPTWPEFFSGLGCGSGLEEETLPTDKVRFVLKMA
jgi:hypothetical protein